MARARVQRRVRLHGNKRGMDTTRDGHTSGGSSMGNSLYDGNPYGDHAVARLRIRDALDPGKAPSRVKTLRDMSPDERAEMARLYGGGK